MKYIVSVDWWELTIEVTDEEKAKAAMKESLLFFVSGKERIESCNGNIIEAFAKQLANVAIYLSVEYSLSGVVAGIGERFEGYPRMDGSEGFKLVQLDSFYYDENDFSVRSVS